MFHQEESRCFKVGSAGGVIGCEETVPAVSSLPIATVGAKILAEIRRDTAAYQALWSTVAASFAEFVTGLIHHAYAGRRQEFP